MPGIDRRVASLRNHLDAVLTGVEFSLTKSVKHESSIAIRLDPLEVDT